MPEKFKVRSDPYTYDTAKDLVAKLANTSTRLLDVGCGSGVFLNMVKDSVGERHGTDFNIDQYSEEENKHNIKQVNLNTELLPYEKESYDMVTCLDVFEHIFNPCVTLGEMLRVVKSGGYIIVTTPNVHNFIHRITFALTGGLKGFWNPTHNVALGETHVTPIFRQTLEYFLKGKGEIAETTFNRTVIPLIRIELSKKNYFLSETVIWVIKKN